MEWTKVITKFDHENWIRESNIPWKLDILVTDGVWVEFVNDHGWDKEEYYFNNGMGKLNGVTHFMELPKPPEKE